MKMQRFLFRFLLCLAVGSVWDTTSHAAEPRASRKGATAQAEQVCDPKTVLLRWIKTMGGTDRLQKLHDLDSTLKIGWGAGTESQVLHVVEAAGGMYRYELSIDGIQGGCDGARAWHHSDRLGFGFVEPYSFIGEVWRTNALDALNLSTRFSAMVGFASERIGNESCSVIGLTDARSVQEKWYFSNSSGDLLRIARPAAAGVGAYHVDYSDFRKVNGVKLPYLISASWTGGSVTAHRLSGLLNGSVYAEMFQPPTKDLKDKERIDEALKRYREALAADRKPVHSRVLHATVESFPSGTVTRVVISQKEPNLIVREEEVPGLGKTYVGFDGTTGWVYGEIQGFRLLKETELAQLKTSSISQTSSDVTRLYPLSKYMGTAVIDGRATVALAIADVWFPRGTLYFDASTGMLARFESDVELSAHKIVHMVNDYSDYRLVEGVPVAFRIVQTTPTLRMVTTCQSIEMNTPLGDELFQPRKDD